LQHNDGAFFISEQSKMELIDLELVKSESNSADQNDSVIQTLATTQDSYAQKRKTKKVSKWQSLRHSNSPKVDKWCKPSPNSADQHDSVIRTSAMTWNYEILHHIQTNTNYFGAI
jgi:hypothetical protein